MIKILYNIFIYPIELFIELVIESSYGITGSYAISIVVVSIVISTLLLPVYYLIEKMQDELRLKKETMKPHLEDIKKSFKGYELHLYTKQVYRTHNYHPLSELKTSVGLLIQLPFLLAAYHFIASYNPLHGVSFLLIPDLSQPDRLLQIAGFNINLLPIIMTLVNIASIYLYSEASKIKSNLQLYILPFAFLLLLYQAPSGLLIYWTCNNVFSFFKYYILYSRRQKSQ
jgi:YidC/Oxa1 family membrane protein insertase